MRRSIRRVAMAAATVVLTFSSLAACQPPQGSGAVDAATKAPARKGRPRVTISKETTFITEPLRPDGYPDYLAALNRRCSEGVTPENNAAVLLWQALGPEPVPEEIRKRFFAMLGVPVPPPEGEYFVPFDVFARQALGKPTGRLDEERQTQYELYQAQFDQALRRPWSAAEFPLVARWLERNRKPLELVVAASQRSHCYFPVLGMSPDSSLIEASLVSQQMVRQVVRALVCRAMFRLPQDQITEAWHDLLACHRLSQHVARNPQLLCLLIGIGCDSLACDAMATLAVSMNTGTGKPRGFLTQLNEMSPEFDLRRTLHYGERFNCLDMVCRMIRKGPQAFDSASRGTGKKGFPLGNFGQFLWRFSMDWDAMLRDLNREFDGLVAASSKPVGCAMIDHLRTIEQQWETLIMSQKRKVFSWKMLVPGISGSYLRKTRTRTMTLLLLALMAPAAEASAQAVARANMQFDLVRLALALAAYRAEHGEYPGRLAELAPAYLEEIPQDIFADAPLHYRRQGDGYVLYSVGINCKDDGGRGWEDAAHADGPETADWDDLVVRTPGAKP